MIAVLGCGNSKYKNIDNIEPAEEVDGKFSTLCIEGHVYYLLKPTNSIAPKLSDNGKPVKCE
jgi:hypothetical protein